MANNETTEVNRFGIEGFQEAVLSIRNIETWIAFYEEVANWEVISEGNVDPNILVMWDLPSSCTAKEVVMGNPGDNNGFVRLIEFDHVEQTHIRSNAQLWETGGIAAISTRCKSISTSSNTMKNWGWQGFHDPVEWQFGPFSVSEWVARGNDGVVQSITERLAPPLEGWDTMTLISRVFNSPQIVNDIDKATDFYRNILDFKTVLHHAGIPENGENVFGLPYEVHTSKEHEIYMLHPEGGTKTGTVELIAFEGLSGRDFSSRGVPPNLGVLMLRFPIGDMKSFVHHLETMNIDYVLSELNTSISPYGSVTLLALKTPEGAWLEFYQTN